MLTSLMHMVLSLTTTAIAASSGRSFWMPRQASTEAAEIDFVFNFITWISIVFFVGIVGVMLYFMWRYRRRDPHGIPEGGPTHHTPLEITWTVIPLILVIAIFYVGMRGYINLHSPPANTYDVNVTGQKWSWSFEHRNGAISSTELKVPVDRPVKLIMTSKDVLHALFIPAFRVKRDVVPGRYTYLWFEATEPGEYDLYCAEYCGTGHSIMQAKVIVLEEQEFQRQIEKDAQYMDQYTDEQLHEAGAVVFSRHGCSSCHTLDGSASTGPSFRETHSKWGGERVFQDGSTRVVDENYIRESLFYPQREIVQSYTGAMPTFKGELSERKVRAIAEFIKRLNEFDDQGNYLGSDE